MINLKDSIDFGSFLARGCIGLIHKDSKDLMHALAVYLDEELPSTCDSSVKNLDDFYL